MTIHSTIIAHFVRGLYKA